MHKRLAGWAARRGAEAALQVAQNSVPKATRRDFQRVFSVTLPVTVYIHASNARVTVHRGAPDQVTLDAALQASFGWHFVAEQDDSGVYIVARRRPIVGALSFARFTLTVPDGARLLADLRGGSLHLADLDGQIDIPPLRRP